MPSLFDIIHDPKTGSQRPAAEIDPRELAGALNLLYPGGGVESLEEPIAEELWRIAIGSRILAAYPTCYEIIEAVYSAGADQWLEPTVSVIASGPRLWYLLRQEIRREAIQRAIVEWVFPLDNQEAAALERLARSLRYEEARAAAPHCPHGKGWGECNDCLQAADLEYDARREASRK